MNPYSFSENLLVALKRLRLLLEKQKISYMLIGGIAVALWGEPRATQDIDIVVLVSEDRAFDFLKEAKKYGFSYQERRIWHDIRTLGLMLKRQKLPY